MQKFPRKYCLINQMNRSAISIPSNVAGSFKKKEERQMHFLNIAFASLMELRAREPEISNELGYLSREEFCDFTPLKKLCCQLHNYIAMLKDKREIY